METAYSDQQLFEEFARDLNLSAEDIKEIENNEECKAWIYRTIRGGHIIDKKFLFWLHYGEAAMIVKPLFFPPPGEEFGIYGVSRGLSRKFYSGGPDDLEKWLDPVYWQDNLRLRDSFLRVCTWEELQKYEWADKQDYERAKAVKPEICIWWMLLGSVILTPLIFVLGLLMALITDFVVVAIVAITMGVEYKRWLWYDPIWTWVVCFAISFALLYLFHLKELRRYNQRLRIIP